MNPDLVRNLDEYGSHWRSRFRKTWNYSSQTKVRRFRGLMKRVGLIDRERLAVFDQGFGLGLMLFCFPPSSRLAGVELSETAIDGAAAAAKRLGYKEVDFRKFEPSAMYPDSWRGSFDVVISSHVLEHIAEPGGALRDLIGLMRPDGVACLVVPINETPGQDLNHFYYFTPKSFLDLLERCDLESIHVLEADRLWDLVGPVAYAQQRRPTWWLKGSSIVMNACTGILPLAALQAVDRLLGWFGFNPRQLFVLCRKKGAAAEASLGCAPAGPL